MYSIYKCIYNNLYYILFILDSFTARRQYHTMPVSINLVLKAVGLCPELMIVGRCRSMPRKHGGGWSLTMIVTPFPLYIVFTISNLRLYPVYLSYFDAKERCCNRVNLAIWQLNPEDWWWGRGKSIFINHFLGNLCIYFYRKQSNRSNETWPFVYDRTNDHCRWEPSIFVLFIAYLMAVLIQNEGWSQQIGLYSVPNITCEVEEEPNF